MTFFTASRAFATAGLCVLLGACSVLPDKPPVSVYQLPSSLPVPSLSHSQEGVSGDFQATIRVTTPAANPTLSGDRILVSRARYQVMAYKGVRWQDQVPRMVRNRLVQALKSSEGWQAVTTENSTARVSFQLGSELMQFQVLDNDGQRKVHVWLDATLIDSRLNRVVGARPFQVESRVEGDDFDAVVVAFGSAADQLGIAVAKWLAAYAKP